MITMKHAEDPAQKYLAGKNIFTFSSLGSCGVCRLAESSRHVIPNQPKVLVISTLTMVILDVFDQV